MVPGCAGGGSRSLSGLSLGITVLPVTKMSFKVSEEESRQIRFLAERENLSLSEYLRRRAIGPSTHLLKPELVRCPLTGAMVFKPATDKSGMTTGAVAEQLSDFP